MKLRILWECDWSMEEKMRFIAIIWPTAGHLTEAIIREIENRPDTTVVAVSHTELAGRFASFVYALYDAADLNEYGHLIRHKIRLMQRRTRRRDICALVLELPNADFANRLKRSLRSAFRDAVKRYEYDIIIHFSDNEEEYLRAKYLLGKY